MAVAAASLACGCSASAPSATLPAFDDIETAPPAIQAAAEAVVLVSMPGFSATACFISPDGLLLTNNHVLGVGVCPVEGCYTQLTFDYQRGAPLQQPVTAFVVPKAVDVGLDVAVLQAYSAPGGATLATPYVTVDSRAPADLLGTHVTVVGQPEGSLKKWSSGDVVDTDGSWVWTAAFSLPGNSGSPFLDDHGHLVAILHRGPDSLDLVTASGVNTYSIGTASSPLIAAMAEPLPASMWSIAESTTSAEVASQDLIYLAARKSTANVDGTPQLVLSSLGAACDAALAVTDYASPEDMSAAQQPCFDAENWIECRADALTSYAVCPSDTNDWQRRFQAVFDTWLSFNGELELNEVSFAMASLSDSMADGQKFGAQLLSQALAEAQPPLDFDVALYLAAFQISTYQGTSIADFTRNYTRVPDYALEGEPLVSTILWLNYYSVLDNSTIEGLFGALHGDSTIDLGTKLFIEQAEYSRGILP